MKNIAGVGVGSNILPEQNIPKAKTRLLEIHVIVGESSFVKTAPIGNKNQPDFLNGAFLIETDLDFDAFRQNLKDIEKEMGRPQTADKFSPRPIDLDIVVWNDEIKDRDFYHRDFLKKVILEILPELKY